MRCEICDEPIQLLTFDEAAPDEWFGAVPDDDDLVWCCTGCGTFELALRWIPPA